MPREGQERQVPGRLQVLHQLPVCRHDRAVSNLHIWSEILRIGFRAAGLTVQKNDSKAKAQTSTRSSGRKRPGNWNSRQERTSGGNSPRDPGTAGRAVAGSHSVYAGRSQAGGAGPPALQRQAKLLLFEYAVVHHVPTCSMPWRRTSSTPPGAGATPGLDRNQVLLRVSKRDRKRAWRRRSKPMASIPKPLNQTPLMIAAQFGAREWSSSSSERRQSALDGQLGANSPADRLAAGLPLKGIRSKAHRRTVRSSGARLPQAQGRRPTDQIGRQADGSS